MHALLPYKLSALIRADYKEKKENQKAKQIKTIKFAASILGAMASLSSAIELEYGHPYSYAAVCDWYLEECSGLWWRSPCYQDYDSSGRNSIRWDWGGEECGRFYMMNN